LHESGFYPEMATKLSKELFETKQKFFYCFDPLLQSIGKILFFELLVFLTDFIAAMSKIYYLQITHKSFSLYLPDPVHSENHCGFLESFYQEHLIGLMNWTSDSADFPGFYKLQKRK